MNCFFEILGGYGLSRYKFCLEGKTFRSAGSSETNWNLEQYPHGI